MIMKKNLIFAAMSSLTVIFAVSCAKETPVGTEETPVEEGLKTVTLTAGVETKVNSEDGTLKWNSSAENLAVFGQVGEEMVKYQFSKPAGTSATEAQFSGTVSENALLKYASYPYTSSEDWCNCTADGVLSFHLDPELSYNATNSVPNKTPLYGVISGESLTMKSACAYLKIMLPMTNAGETLEIYKSVTVSAAGCCGTFTVDCTGDSPVISSGSGNELVNTPRKSRSGNIYIPVIPGTYDDITITIEYIDDSGYPVFVKKSTSSQTFVAGKFYDCHEMSGAYAESVASGDAKVEGTTLTMNASAVVWKYSGITNEDYNAKFFYAEAGTEKGASGWTEVSGTISGETNEVALTATAEVEAGKNYQFYAQISDGVKTYDSEIVAVAAKRVVGVVWNFAEIAAGGGETYTPYTYNSTESGRKRIVNSEGAEVFPTFSITASKADFYYQVWNGSAYSTTEQVTSGTASTNAAGMLGGTTTCTVDGATYALTIASTSSYYTFFSTKLCHGSKGFNIKMECPENAKITKVLLQTAKNDICKWGIGTTGSSSDNVAEVDYKNTEADVSQEIVINEPNKEKAYYLISGNKGSRIQVLTVYYEY